jgi:hypothetical protein
MQYLSIFYCILKVYSPSNEAILPPISVPGGTVNLEVKFVSVIGFNDITIPSCLVIDFPSSLTV